MFAGWIGSLFVARRVGESPVERDVDRGRAGIADVVCFGGFFALGVSGHHLRYRLSRSRRWSLAVFFGAAGLACGVRRATDRHGRQQLLRAARPRRPRSWLLVMLALEDQLRHLGEISAIKRFVGWIAGNSMSIYLWHTLALVLRVLHRRRADLARSVRDPRRGLRRADRLDRHRGPPARVARLGRRKVLPERCGSSRSSLLVLGFALVANQPHALPPLERGLRPADAVGSSAVRRRRRRRGASMNAANAAPATSTRGRHGQERRGVVARTRRRRRRGRRDRGRRPARTRCSSSTATPRRSIPTPVRGAEPDQDDGRRGRTATGRRGTLTLDGPLPPIDGIADRDDGHAHAAPPAEPLDRPPDYRESADYRADMILTPVAAGQPRRGRQRPRLRRARVTPRRTSSSPALAIETVTGTTAQRGARRADLRSRSAWTTPRWSTTHGRASSARHRAVSCRRSATSPRWYNALMRERHRAVAGDARRDDLGRQRVPENAGLGSWRHCPCDPPSAEYPEPFLYTYHDGGDIRVVYIPSRDVVLAMRFSKPLYDADQIVGDDRRLRVRRRRPPGRAGVRRERADWQLTPRSGTGQRRSSPQPVELAAVTFGRPPGPRSRSNSGT